VTHPERWQKMKLLCLFLFSSGIVMAADIRAFMWQESRDEKTREPQYGFLSHLKP